MYLNDDDDDDDDDDSVQFQHEIPSAAVFSRREFNSYTADGTKLDAVPSCGRLDWSVN